MTSQFDTLKGMFMGVALGDALGVPFEFKSFRVDSEIGKPSTLKYTGLLLEEDGMIQFQYQQTKILAGSVSDDTEMTIASFRSILQTQHHNGGYVWNDVKAALQYMEWANSRPPMMGRNTRALFQGVKTMKGFASRQLKIFLGDFSNASQSNGSLMRCSPLVVISGFDNMLYFSDKDVDLSNPNDVNRTCSRIYLSVLKKIVDGNATRETIRTYLTSQLEATTIPEISTALNDALSEYFTRDVSINRGWVCHAFSIALYTYLHYDNFDSAMRFIILGHSRGDTDTNACIAGALIGASIGYAKMLAEENTSVNVSRLEKFFENSPRKKYGMRDLDELLAMVCDNFS
jgi:ADP-ribosylglycohydrolase